VTDGGAGRVQDLGADGTGQAELLGETRGPNVEVEAPHTFAPIPMVTWVLPPPVSKTLTAPSGRPTAAWTAR
jgi:hypothetical protein